MEGKCLCSKVSFRLSVENIRIYKCFCTLCQKQSGTESNLATIVPDDKFKFLSGEEMITTWVKESGFTSHFCKQCGSPVPNRLRNTAWIWIPVGSLESAATGVVVSHIYTASQRHVTNSHDLLEFAEFPDGGLEGHIENIYV